MATKKSVKSSSSATKKAAPKKAVGVPVTTTTVHTVRASDHRSTSNKLSIEVNTVNIVVAELIGTFILATVAIMTASDSLPLYVGLTMAVLVMVLGAVSGAHINPAVTFGLWATRRLKTVMVPFYWVAQMLGGMAAVVVATAIAGTKLNLSFGHFNTFSWPIFWIELVGTAVFLFGLVSVMKRIELSNTAKAFGIGLSLFVGLVVAGSIYTPMRQAAITSYQSNMSQSKTQTTDGSDIPHQIYVSGATLNPAIALASTETPKSTLLGSSSGDSSTETHYSRLGWEVILGTLIGAALGGNLALLIDYRFKR